MRTYTKKHYNQAIQLRKQFLGARRISIIMKIPKSTIEGWLYRGTKPKIISERYKKAQEKNKKYLTGGSWNRKKLPLSAKKLTTDLAYICGVILGDGYLHKKGRIELLVKDKEFAETFASSVKRWSSFSPKIYKHKYFVVCLSSIEAKNFLSNNLDNLVKQITETKNEKIKCAFLKGLFDSEGSISYNRYKGKVELKMSITNRKIAKVTHLLLSKIGIISKFYKKKRQIKNWKTCYNVVIQKRIMRKLFLEKIGFSIKRKQKILEEACNLEFLERINAHHFWYRKNEIDFLKKYYGVIKTKKIVDKLNDQFWNGKSIRTTNGIYTKIYELKKVGKW